MTTFLKLALAILLAISAASCKYLDGSGGESNLLVETKEETPTASTFGNGPEKVWLDKAKEYFRRGEYGLAERYYRQAIEERHNNVEAWLGLAASYDHLKRFDEADKAYKAVTSLIGNTPTVLNNLGYHYMLKGDLAAAEKALQEAQRRDPNNPYIKNNLVLLANWKAKAGMAG
jgi:Flp pilus assembly protein TadD